MDSGLPQSDADPLSDFLKSQVGLSDVAIALAAGAAGSLAFTTGLPGVILLLR